MAAASAREQASVWQPEQAWPGQASRPLDAARAAGVQVEGEPAAALAQVGWRDETEAPLADYPELSGSLPEALPAPLWAKWRARDTVRRPPWLPLPHDH